MQWGDSRKGIIGICLNQMKYRDNKLHDETDLNENLEKQFAYRAEHLDGGNSQSPHHRHGSQYQPRCVNRKRADSPNYPPHHRDLYRFTFCLDALHLRVAPFFEWSFTKDFGLYMGCCYHLQRRRARPRKPYGSGRQGVIINALPPSLEEGFGCRLRSPLP